MYKEIPETIQESRKKLGERERIKHMKQKGAGLSTITASRWCIRDKKEKK